MVELAEVPPGIVTRLRAACLRLPDAYEEPAWVGTRWRVRTRTFAHVLTVERDWPPAYARAMPANGPSVVLTFRAGEEELGALSNAGPPFYRAPWGSNVVGMILGDDLDWAEITELITESYCVLAPRKLVALVDRPGPPS